MASTLATSGRRAHMVVSVPASANTFANAVPHDPAPNTAALAICSIYACVIGAMPLWHLLEFDAAHTTVILEWEDSGMRAAGAERRAQ
ncbi:hypothetical protein [Nocardia sp. NPDC004711]